MISSIKIVVELFAYLYCLAGLFGKKFRLSIHAMILMVLDLFVLTGINKYGFPEYLRSLVYIGMFMYGLLYYKESIKVTLINSFVAAVFVTFLQLVLCLPAYYLLVECHGQKNINEVIINLLCLIIIIVVNRKLNLNKISGFFARRNKLVIYILIFVLIGLGINIYQIKKSGVLLKEQYIQIVYFVILFAFTINEWQKSRMDAEKKKAQLEMNKLYYEAYDQLILLVRERQHDMKNHINAILSMIHTTDNYEELVAKQQEYCGYVIQQNEKTKLLLSSGNPLITGFLYSKIQEAEMKGIIVEYDLGIKKKMLFPEYELIEMLGILLDNAIEALEKKEIPKKQIYISVKENQNELEIMVANNGIDCKNERIDKFFERGYSSKGENRGIGLAKLKSLVYEKNGNIVVSNEQYHDDNFLIFEMVVPKIIKSKYVKGSR
ncbi:MAG: GHKL domain-containing protein [Lachnospiraceae bacterium]|nr:GHKL domain-containing protein [Lachnospiraceae bacterium]